MSKVKMGTIEEFYQVPKFKNKSEKFALRLNFADPEAICYSMGCCS
jgi:hypothetical protein